MEISRRSFLTGAAAATAGCATVPAESSATHDENLAVLLSDIHIGGKASDPNYQMRKFIRTVDEILAMRPLPANAVVFGDIAFLFGRKADYEVSAPQFERLRDAGIGIVFGLGNHDHRKAFFEQYPNEADKSLVPGYAVFELKMPDVDLLMLDSLWEDRSKLEAYNPVPGMLEKPVWEFLAKDLPARTRPVLLCSHHNHKELRYSGDLGADRKDGPDAKWTMLSSIIKDAPAVKGLIHGHNHRWHATFMQFGYSGPEVNRVVRSICLPSTGHWGDIGYALLRTAPGRAVVELKEGDFYFPSPVEPEKRPPQWDATVADHQGVRCTFAW